MKSSAFEHGTGAFAGIVASLASFLDTTTSSSGPPVDLEDQLRAVRALGAIGPDAAPAVPALVAWLDARPREGRGRRELVEALGEIGPGAANAAPRLAAILRGSGAWDPARPGVPRALSKIGGDAAVAALIEAACEHPDDPQGPGQDAISALGRLGARAAAPALLELHADPRFERVRKTIVRALAEIGPPSGRVLDVVLALGNVEALYHLLFTAPVGEVDPRAADALLAALDVHVSGDRDDDDRGEDAAYWALLGLGHLRDRRAAARCMALLAAPSARVREEAARTLGFVGGDTPGAVEALVSRLDAERERDRCMAAFALGWLGPVARGALPRLRELRAAGRLAAAWLRWDLTLARIDPATGRSASGETEA